MRIPRLRGSVRKRIPAITSRQMVEARRIASEEFGVSPLQMMENAGRNLADLTMAYLGSPRSKAAIVLAGGGFSGGAGMVAARHLISRGVATGFALCLTGEEVAEDVARQLHTLQKMEAAMLFLGDEEIARLDFMEAANVIIDALVDYGTNGEPVGAAVAAIGAANRSYKRILSLEAPSGLNPDTGDVGDPCIRARATLALALPKEGLVRPEAGRRVGRLYLADIGIPREVFSAFDLDVGPVFALGALVGL